VEADIGQPEQVLLNLVVNARDAMPEGGVLTIETANVELDDVYARDHPGSRPGTYAMLAVGDTGVGMDEELLPYIFEPFFTTKEEGKGTGLGLATVYGIVKQSDGYIWPESEPGRGTTFRIYLPRVEERIEPAEREQAPIALPRGTETILVVEDEDSVRELTRRVLERQGYEVLAAGHPGEALRLCAEHTEPIHLLLTDIVMPGMHGCELAERLVPSRPETRVLYMSGYPNEAITRQEVMGAGEDFLQKPFTSDALVCTIREILDRSSEGD
jgi:CheY-like chemotaxis protein